MKEDEKFNSFFKLHSENVDNANNQGFWKLSDEIIKIFDTNKKPTEIWN